MYDQEQTEELQLEKKLAELLWPNMSLTYDENGNYWYMNERGRPSPNFGGYVPKWTRDGDACFDLMIEHNIALVYFTDHVKAKCNVTGHLGDIFFFENPEEKKVAARKSIVSNVIKNLSEN